jgi:hypothetical protein
MRPRFIDEERRTIPCTSYPFCSKKLGEIRAVLPCNARDQCLLPHCALILGFQSPPAPGSGPRGVGGQHAIGAQQKELVAPLKRDMEAAQQTCCAIGGP